MSNYFFESDAKEKIKEIFLTDKAKFWAESFINPKPPKERWQRNPKLTSAQLRRFHIEAKTLEERVKNLKNADDFIKIRPLVKMLKSKVAYACPITGSDRKVPEEFRKYIEEMVDNIDDINDFKAFALCFEAVVGFFYGQGGR
ncbi:MAG: type III-A CRISPR-associated protein Csm2 [Candidatus Firestonebacteria bacterium]|nr:type III-A CRISPR-associated protein Csm2 [Candidatus Firestonebacteria bacterium]